MSMMINYLKAGDSRIPALEIPEQPKLNHYARLRKQFLQSHKPNRYTALLISGDLMNHLVSVGNEAEQLILSRQEELLAANPAPEKAVDSMAWAMHMMKIRQAAEEMVLKETVFA